MCVRVVIFPANVAAWRAAAKSGAEGSRAAITWPMRQRAVRGSHCLQMRVASVWAVVAALSATAAVSAAESMHEDLSTLWGTYRPQLFFGMRPRMPDTVLTGLAWFSVASHEHYGVWRHKAADMDGIDSFTWTYHDGRTFGEQQIIDRTLNYKIETSFVKTGHASDSAGNWAVRVRGTVLDRAHPAALSTLFYLGTEQRDAPLVANASGVHGSNAHIGPFALRTEAHAHNRPVGDAPTEAFAAVRAQPASLWRGAEFFVAELNHQLAQLAQGATSVDELPAAAEVLQLSNHTDAGAVLYALQRTYAGDFAYDVFFDAEQAPRGTRLNSASLSAALEAHRAAYEARFSHTFDLTEYSPQQRQDAREITSQLLGGIGYYHGASLVDGRPADADDLVLHDHHVMVPKPTPPRGLLTATPSRAAFPRGFYWDEGFHLLHIYAWDPSLAMELMESWSALIDDDGWVAREQILGAEARAQVPEAFQTQNPLYGNPPTLVFGLLVLLDGAQRRDPHGNAEQLHGPLSVAEPAGALLNITQAAALLGRLYEPWRRHYAWFRRTQRGQIAQWDRDATSRVEAYRWRGRSDRHVLTSGLDDYPRARVPHVGELHVDLLAWMGSFARAMGRIATQLGHVDDAEEYMRHEHAIRKNLVDLHWDAARRSFCDLSVDDADDSYAECHDGYVSLFPFMLRLIRPDSEQLGAALDLLRDPARLWSPHGIRSLSAAHPLYGTDEDYWRSAIWVPVNYLVLGALRAYAHEHGPHQALAAQLYRELRVHVVRTVLEVCSRRTRYLHSRTRPRGIRGSSTMPRRARAAAAIPLRGGHRSSCSSWPSSIYRRTADRSALPCLPCGETRLECRKVAFRDGHVLGETRLRAPQHVDDLRLLRLHRVLRLLKCVDLRRERRRRRV